MKQNITLKLFTVIIILSLFTLNAYSIIKGNQGGSEGFEEGTNPSSNSNISAEKRAGGIEYYIITGATYFLKSHSDTQKFLSEVEIMDMYGKDFEKLNEILESAIRNMERSELEYRKLKEKTDITPYKRDFITELICFNYKEFEMKNNLNTNVFNEVSEYLSMGNICGLFDKSLLDVQDLIKKIKTIQTYIKTGIYPNNHLFWRLNQKFSDSQLFGQYASEVFYKISGKY